MSITSSGSSRATARPIVSALRSMPGPLVTVTPEVAAEGGAERHVRGGDLVLGLHGANAEALVARELVQQLGGGRDGVAGEEQRQAAPDARRDQPKGRRLSPVDAAVGTGLGRGGLDLVVDLKQLGRLAEVVARAEGRQVRLHQRRRGGELLLDPANRHVHRAAVHPGDQPEREEVLRARRVAGRDPVDAVGGSDGHRGHRDAKHLIVVERSVLERAGRVLGLAQGGVREPVLVDDQDAAALELGQVHLQGRRVHRDQRVGAAAGGQYVPGGEVDLERRDAGQGPRGRPDLGREVGQRHQVVADQGGRRGETVARELYAVARIAREADDNPLLFLENLGQIAQERGRSSIDSTDQGGSACSAGSPTLQLDSAVLRLSPARRGRCGEIGGSAPPREWWRRRDRRRGLHRGRRSSARGETRRRPGVPRAVR